MHPGLERGVDYTDYRPDRVAMQDATAQMAVLQFMLMVPGVQDADFSSLDTIVYGASPISEEVLARSIATFGARFWQAYGLTETTGSVVNLAPADHDLDGPNRHRLRSCGVAGPGVELRIDHWQGLHRHDEAASRRLVEWADVVVCEWAGPNAVWYARHKRPGQRLVVRLHATALGGRLRLLLPTATVLSVSATAALRASGRSAKQSRAVVDQAAAVALLQGVLDGGA